jgi:hypothetical protein
MARKPTQPALYELIRHKPRQAVVVAPTTRAEPAFESKAAAGPSGSGGGLVASPMRVGSAADEPAVTSGSLGGPGRFLKVPVGYAYVAIGVALALVVMVYMYGFSSGEAAATKRFDERRLDEMVSQGNLPAVDPLKAGRTPTSLIGKGGAGDPLGLGTGDNGQPGSNEAQKAAGAGSGDDGTDLGPPSGSDPRQPGLNYFVLAGRLSALEGDPMVRFCRKNGLDAHLVPDDNARLRLLIVCPGFAAGERQSPAVKALESKIRAVGRKWKSTGPGNRDFGDLYPKKHRAG